MRFIKEQARFANLTLQAPQAAVPQGEQYDNYESPAPAAAATSPLQNMTGAAEFAIGPATPIAQTDDSVPF